jgi:hypothetical protein
MDESEELLLIAAELSNQINSTRSEDEQKPESDDQNSDGGHPHSACRESTDGSPSAGSSPAISDNEEDQPTTTDDITSRQSLQAQLQPSSVDVDGTCDVSAADDLAYGEDLEGVSGNELDELASSPNSSSPKATLLEIFPFVVKLACKIWPTLFIQEL